MPADHSEEVEDEQPGAGDPQPGHSEPLRQCLIVGCASRPRNIHRCFSSPSTTSISMSWLTRSSSPKRSAAPRVRAAAAARRSADNRTVPLSEIMSVGNAGSALPSSTGFSWPWAGTASATMRSATASDRVRASSTTVSSCAWIGGKNGPTTFQVEIHSGGCAATHRGGLRTARGARGPEPWLSGSFLSVVECPCSGGRPDSWARPAPDRVLEDCDILAWGRPRKKADTTTAAEGDGECVIDASGIATP
jgi:hypothetical protein